MRRTRAIVLAAVVLCFSDCASSCKRKMCKPEVGQLPEIYNGTNITEYSRRCRDPPLQYQGDIFVEVDRISDMDCSLKKVKEKAICLNTNIICGGEIIDHVRYHQTRIHHTHIQYETVKVFQGKAFRGKSGLNGTDNVTSCCY